MASPIDILTTDEAKRYLNIKASETAFSPLLAELITEASMHIDDLCGPVVRRDVTYSVLEPSGSVFLPVPPGSPTFTVTFATVTEYSAGVPTVLTAEDADTSGTYRFDARLGRVLRRSSWSGTSWGLQEVVIAYEAGRFDATADVDQKFKGACRKVLAHKMRARGATVDFATGGGDGEPYGGIPYTPKKLDEHLASDLRNEMLLDALGLVIG